MSVRAAVCNPPQGSGSINGEWVAELWIQYDPIENGFNISSTGGAYTAKFDGKRWPYKEPGEDSDSVRFTRIDDSSFYEIKYKGDVVTYIYRHSISSDGNEVQVEALNAKSGNFQRFLQSRKPVEVQRQN